MTLWGPRLPWLLGNCEGSPLAWARTLVVSRPDSQFDVQGRTGRLLLQWSICNGSPFRPRTQPPFQQGHFKKSAKGLKLKPTYRHSVANKNFFQ